MLIGATARAEEETSSVQEERLKVLKEQQALLTEQKKLLDAQLALIKAQYGEAAAGKSGAVGELSNYSAYINSYSLGDVASAGRALCPKLCEVPATCYLVTEDQAISTNLERARTVRTAITDLTKSLDRLNTDMPSSCPRRLRARAMSPVLIAATIGGIVNSISSVVKLFQHDYQAAALSPSAPPPGFLAANVVAEMRDGCALSNSKPTILTDAVANTARSQLSIDLENLQSDAVDRLTKAMRAPEAAPCEGKTALVASLQKMVEAINQVHAELNKPSDKGIAPIQIFGVYDKAITNNATVIQLLPPVQAGLVLNKTSVFGSGGKLYALARAQVIAIVSKPDGYVDAICATSAAATWLKLSELTRKSSAIPGVKRLRSSTAETCGIATNYNITQ